VHLHSVAVTEDFKILGLASKYKNVPDSFSKILYQHQMRVSPLGIDQLLARFDS